MGNCREKSSCSPGTSTGSSKSKIATFQEVFLIRGTTAIAFWFPRGYASFYALSWSIPSLSFTSVRWSVISYDLSSFFTSLLSSLILYVHPFLTLSLYLYKSLPSFPNNYPGIFLLWFIHLFSRFSICHHSNLTSSVLICLCPFL